MTLGADWSMIPKAVKASWAEPVRYSGSRLSQTTYGEAFVVVPPAGIGTPVGCLPNLLTLLR
ncbi:MAG TPA: hypothetical protein QF761_03990 [Pirellulales bacterium]|nr:hypothetical protein [Pirellulales bacterium]